jgi:hypothetical protein
VLQEGGAGRTFIILTGRTASSSNAIVFAAPSIDTLPVLQPHVTDRDLS